MLDRERRARALGASEFFVKPMEQAWLLRKLQAMAAQRPERAVRTVLVIDDDDVSRYLVRRLLAETPYRVIEAADGADGVVMAREQRPDVIILDFVLRSETAFDVLDALKLDPDTRGIPVIVSTSRQLALARIRDALSQVALAAGAQPPGGSGDGHAAMSVAQAVDVPPG